MMQLHPPVRRRASGFTLVELLTAAGLFVVIATIALATYVNVFSANRSTNAERLVVDESSFVMESLVKELRNGIIDYPEYWRWARSEPPAAPDPYQVRDDYVRYLQQSPSALAGLAAIRGDEDVPSTVALPHPGLIILSADGSARTVVYRRVVAAGARAGEGELVVRHERLAYDQQVAADPDDDVWYWIDAEASTCTAAMAATLDPLCAPVEHVLTSDAVDVRGFTFRIAPARDPFFAYEDTSVQVQPMVHLVLDVASSVTRPVSRTDTPRITLSTTTSIRSYAPAEWLDPTLLP